MAKESVPPASDPGPGPCVICNGEVGDHEEHEVSEDDTWLGYHCEGCCSLAQARAALDPMNLD